MVELLLIIALTIAIILDCVRIVQYIKMRKVLDEKSKVKIADKINRLHKEWLILASNYTIGQYCMEHWHEK